MKLCLVFAIFLLVPIVSADLRSNVLAKILHKDDHFISEAVDTSRIEYKYFDWELRFVLLNNTQRFSNYMLVKGDSLWQFDQPEFALEMFEEESMRGVNCSEKSEEHMRRWIVQCNGPIAIRSLTREESLQVRHYELAQRESKEAFRVMHKHNEIRTESFGQIDFATFVKRESSGQENEIYVRSEVNSWDVRLMHLKNTKIDTPVVIVGHPLLSRVNCRHLDSSDMSVHMCTGPVSARRVN